MKKANTAVTIALASTFTLGAPQELIKTGADYLTEGTTAHQTVMNVVDNIGGVGEAVAGACTKGGNNYTIHLRDGGNINRHAQRFVKKNPGYACCAFGSSSGIGYHYGKSYSGPEIKTMCPKKNNWFGARVSQLEKVKKGVYKVKGVSLNVK